MKNQNLLLVFFALLAIMVAVASVLTFTSVKEQSRDLNQKLLFESDSAPGLSLAHVEDKSAVNEEHCAVSEHSYVRNAPDGSEKELHHRRLSISRVGLHSQKDLSDHPCVRLRSDEEVFTLKLEHFTLFREKGLNPEAQALNVSYEVFQTSIWKRPSSMDIEVRPIIEGPHQPKGVQSPPRKTEGLKGPYS